MRPDLGMYTKYIDEPSHLKVGPLNSYGLSLEDMQTRVKETRLYTSGGSRNVNSLSSFAVTCISLGVECSERNVEVPESYSDASRLATSVVEQVALELFSSRDFKPGANHALVPGLVSICLALSSPRDPISLVATHMVESMRAI